MKTNKNITSYRFAGAWYHQRPLLYHEDCAAREIIRRQVGACPEPEDHEGLSRALSKLWDTPAYPELFRVILKPGKGPGLWDKVQFVAMQGLSDTGMLLQRLTKAEIAGVMRDFFVYRQSWTEDFIVSTLTTGSLKELEKLVESVQRQQKKSG